MNPTCRFRISPFVGLLLTACFSLFISACQCNQPSDISSPPNSPRPGTVRYVSYQIGAKSICLMFKPSALKMGLVISAAESCKQTRMWKCRSLHSLLQLLPSSIQSILVHGLDVSVEKFIGILEILHLFQSSLQALYFEGCNFDQTVAKLCHPLKGDSLKLFQLQDCRISDADLSLLVKSLPSSLKFLQLSHLQWEGNPVGLDPLLIKRLINLTGITLNQIGLCQLDDKPLIDRLMGMPKLMNIRLSHNNIANYVLVALTRRTHRQPLTIDLSNNPMEDVLPETINNLEKLTSLKQLVLSGTDLTHLGDSLLALASKLESLTMVCNNCKFSPDFISKLNQIPHIKQRLFM